MSDSEDEIRKPDKIIKEKLIDDDISLNSNEENSEFISEIELALEVSKKECRDKFELQDVLEKSMNDYSNELDTVLRISQVEYLEQIENNEKKKIERYDLITNFLNKFKRIKFDKENEIKIKILIENTLEQYLNLYIDYIFIDDIELYEDLYKLIDSYFKIPFENKRRTFISENEDKVLRKIFLKN